MISKNSKKSPYNPPINVDMLLKQQSEFNNIKQLCLHYDFKKGKSMTASAHYADKINKNNLGHFCFVLLNLVFCHGSIEFLRQKYGDINGHIYLRKITKSDSLYANFIKVAEGITKNDVSLKKFQSVFHELSMLYDELYKK